MALMVMTSSIVGKANDCTTIPIPSSVASGSGSTQYDRMVSWCRGAGGNLRTTASGGWYCEKCSTTGSTTGSPPTSANPYDAFAADFVNWFFNIGANAKAAADRRAAMIRYLQEQQRDAIRRQQTANAQWLSSVLDRLTTGDLALKQVGGAGELQLKLGSEPILFQEYMSTPATSTTKAQISLTTGDDAAPAAATSTATTTALTNASQPQLTPEMKALAEELSKLTPEQKQKLREAIKGSDTQSALGTTIATTSSQKAADTQLSLKITETTTAANDPNASPEALSKQAADQFKQLQQTTATATQSTSDARKGSPDSGTAQQTANDLNAASKNTNVSAEQVSVRSGKDFDKLPQVATPSAGTIVSPQPPANNSLSRIMKNKIDVPMWRPEGWVGSASKGERTLKFVGDAKKRGDCDSPEQQDGLAKLAIKSNQLAGVERLINRLNATSPRLQAEIGETISEMEKDRDEFVETITEKLGDDLFDLRSRVRNQEFLKATAGLAEANALREKVESWNDLVEAAKSKGKLDKAKTLAGLLGEMSDALQGIRSPELKALRRQLRPFSLFSDQYETAEFAAEMIDTFATLLAYDLNGERLSREIDARNRALAGIEPLHKRLSSDVDKLMNASPIAACSISKP